MRWKMACERIVFFAPGQAEETSVFSDEEAFERRSASNLPAGAAGPAASAWTSRGTSTGPEALAPAADQNFLYDPATGKIHRLDERELFRRIAAELPHLPDLRRGQPAQRRAGRRHGPDHRRHGGGRRYEHVNARNPDFSPGPPVP